MEDGDGFKIIHNPKKGLWEGNKRIKLTRKLSLGVLEGDSNLVFSDIRDIEVDTKGNIYVLDKKNYRVQKFDRQGGYLLTIGRKGKGPGEFIYPQDMVLDSKDNLYVLDATLGVRKFSAEGNFLGSFKIAYFMAWDILINNKDKLILIWPKDNKIFHVYDTDGNYLQSFGEPVEVPDEIITKVPDKSIAKWPSYQMPVFSLCVGNGNSVYYANPYNEYEIVKYNENGKSDMKIKRDVKGHQTILRFKNAFTLLHNAFSISILSDGKILNAYYWREGKKSKTLIDIYDRQGRFLLTLDPQIKATCMSVDNEDNLYLGTNDPYPQLIKCSISYSDR